ncbi:period circadian protein homolog 2 [Spea bombifrons]|uniref:period circadian protein homolog 2 n=1 Tax=Spea bombifrons TaxID=233779 RepID=UPI002349CF08|nr:period circadian protein homolog 2 [Spea bombifrons]
MLNQCSDQLPGDLHQTTLNVDLPHNLIYQPRASLQQECHTSHEKHPIEMPHSSLLQPVGSASPGLNSNQGVQPTELTHGMLHNQSDLSKQGHSTALKPLTVDDLPYLSPQHGDKLPLECGAVLGCPSTDQIRPPISAVNMKEFAIQAHLDSLRTLVTDITPGLLQSEDLDCELPSQELVPPPGDTLDDMETCNDSSSNELNESEENGKEPASKSSSGFQPPPCSSAAFSLMMADSEHNPSTSGYSSEQPAKAKTQKDLMKILKELRSYLPSDKRSRGKSSTLASIRYALRCIQQVKANEEYYQLLMVNEEQPRGLDVSCYTVQEIANITSEYTRNNMDVFAVAVSLVTGRILYISEQASVVLRCGADVFSQVRFVELLAPQDVSVFYSSTTPYRLPSWSICNGADSGSLEGMEEKPFYCRISCGRESRREISYHPFRLTPYLIRAQAEGSPAEQLCCVLFAERVHSGYEAPRIPADKRIFTTTHTPSCLFQDIDERAVPLLGYLPQDLIGSPIILHLHPSDRPLMLAVHKKILQHGGQPFDFSPIRFCARNGEYITIDTSWSSFVNPWSRKVSFIIGRHKVRMGPVNEDIFAAPTCMEDQSVQPGIQEITEQIHQLLMQPVHNSSSSGYGSLGSNGSHENPMSAASSSDSNGNLNEDIKDKHASSAVQKEEQGTSGLEVKDTQNPEKQADHAPNADMDDKDLAKDGSESGVCPVQIEELPVKQSPYSYQQISCLDSVIRYLESCSAPINTKRKWESPCNTPSSTSDDDPVQMQDKKMEIQKESPVAGMKLQLGSRPPHTTMPVPGPPSMPVLNPLSIGAKAESVVSLTSHCSYSSTIVHVGDKKTEFEDVPAHLDAVPPASGTTEKEPRRPLGLTKEVLVAHTQKEENHFMSGFMDTKKLSAFQTRCSSYLHERPGGTRRHCTQGAGTLWKKAGKNLKPKAKRVRPEYWDSSSSGLPQTSRCPLTGFNTTAWSQSDTSHPSYPPLSYPILPAYTMPVFPPQQIPMPNESPHCSPAGTYPTQPFPAPMIPPMVALVLPNYLYPPNLPPAMYPVSAPPPVFPGQSSSCAQQMAFPAPQPTLSTAPPAFSLSQPTYPVPQSVMSTPQNAFPVPLPSYAPQTVENTYPRQSTQYPLLPNAPKMNEGLSRSSTPRDPPSPPLFQSRCSSPLQLNLLQLEESQKAERLEGALGLKNVGTRNSTVTPKPSKQSVPLPSRAGSPADAQTSDAMSACSDLMDLLLHEDASCGTCSASSAVSESMTSGSHGQGTSGSQTGSSLTSRSSKYFGSVDSSENNQHQLQKQGKETAAGESVMKYVLQDPMWLLMANADENVMMTYQIPLRDMDAVLKEDKERLKSLQKLQPRFTDEQKKELGEIHPWIQRGGLPQAMEVMDCVYCKERGSDCTEYKEAIQALELSGILESCD